MSIQNINSLGVARCPRPNCSKRVADSSQPCASCLADAWGEDPRPGGGRL